MTIPIRPNDPSLFASNRRAFLGRYAGAIGTLALSCLLEQEQARAGGLGGPTGAGLVPSRAEPTRTRLAKPRARSVICLFQHGGPSQMDLFDFKPELQKRQGGTMPGSVETFQPGNTTTLLGTPFRFRRQGACGMELSEALPYLGTIADEITLVRSMFTEHNNHTEALVMLSTGKIFPGKPALGAWVSYGLGTENQNLPAYIVLRDPTGYNTSGKLVWSPGWLPALYGGVEFSSAGAPVLDLQPAVPRPAGSQRADLQFLARLNEAHRRKFPGESELEARIRNYELAARMQVHAAPALDVSQESAATRALYGLDNPTTASYGTRCLMARRLVEHGVRFVQVFPPPFQPWDSHKDTKGELETICAVTDLPVAGLVRDLKARGLLDETILLWTGEFGRLPVSQGSKGRDHNRNAFSLWLAGGGFKAGYVHGQTDEFGYRAVVDRVSVPDLHATLLHQLGLDHTKLTYRHHGREETLTDAPVSKARVVAGLLQS